ncbi:MAG: hypothetical protein ABI761_06815 [Saprospiraceae bacterium]
MFRKALFTLITLQFLTAFFHSLSFFTHPVASNDTEKQLIDLLTNYKQDMGGGIHRSMYDLFIGLSICFTLICILAGWINVYFLRRKLNAQYWKGLLKIECFVFGALFIGMVVFTFLPPIVLTGLIFIAACFSWYISDKSSLAE